MKILTLDQIKEVLPSLDLVVAMEKGFEAYSKGRAIIPPVGELLMDKGEVHIKYGCLKGGGHYVIKAASGFYDNPKINLPSNNGLMLLFSQDTGELRCILLDEGHLTDLRTAAAGGVVAKCLAPEHVDCIGIIGTGVQARLQLEMLAPILSCNKVMVWGRGPDQLDAYKNDMEKIGFQVHPTLEMEDVMETCNYLVTTTPSKTPLLDASNLRRGVLITAVGSDTPHKQELDSEILGQADLVAADSIAQCLLRGEIFKAIKSGSITEDDIIELGGIVSGDVEGRMSEDQITVADLTGVAVQDLMIAEAVFQGCA